MPHRRSFAIGASNASRNSFGHSEDSWRFGSKRRYHIGARLGSAICLIVVLSGLLVYATECSDSGPAQTQL